jgi:hypothetical protein
MVWSQRAEEIVTRLIAGLSTAQRDLERNHCCRLNALHIGGSMWADYYLRPSGEVIVVGEDYEHPDVDTIHSDRISILKLLVWGSERYPELRELIPPRPLGAVDCRCRQIPMFSDGKILCSECGSVGWLPPGCESAQLFCPRLAPSELTTHKHTPMF